MLAEHTDPTLALKEKESVIRLTVPIVTNDGVQCFLNGTPVPMQLGERWYLRLSDPHSVVNEGAAARVNLSIDMEPNQWVRALIADGE